MIVFPQRQTRATGTLPPAPAAYLLATGLAFLPILGLLPIDYERVVAALVVIPAWYFRPRHPAKPSLPIVDFLLLVTLLTLAVASILGSDHVAPAVVMLANWSWIIAAAILARGLARDRRNMEIILAGLLLGGVVGTIWAWISWHISPSSSFPVYEHPRLLGMHAMVSLIAGLGMLTHTSLPRGKQRLLLAGAVIVCGGLFWSGTRSAGVGFAIAMGTWWLSAPASRRKQLVGYALLVLVIGALLSIALWTPRDTARELGLLSVWQRTAGATSLSTLSSTRSDFWLVCLDAILQRPWLGYGPDAYLFLQPRQDGNQPHNWILQLLLDLGAPAALLAATLGLRQVVRPWRQPEDGSELNRVAAGIALACLASGLLDGYLYHVWALLPAAVCAGAAGAESASRRLTLAGSKWVQQSAGVLLLIAAFVLLAHSLQLLNQTKAPAPPSPDHWRVHALRMFPSYIPGHHGWLTAWKSDFPAEALTLAQWMATESDDPVPLHITAIELLASQGEWQAADLEIDRALEKAHRHRHPTLLRLRALVRAAAVAENLERNDLRDQP